MKFEQHSVLQEFDRLYHLIDELYHEICVKQKLSDSAYAILQAVLILGNGCTQTQVYKYTCLNKQTVNSSVKKLRRDGWIDFQAGGGRERNIYLTGKGETIVKERILPIEQAESEVFDEMTPEEQREMLRLIRKYYDTFRSKVEHRLQQQ